MRLARYTIALAVFTFAFSAAAFADDPATVDLYKKKCAACHGQDGKPTAAGTKLGAKDFADPEVVKMKDAELAETTKNGKNKMPAYGKSLSDDQIKSLVAQVRTLAKAGKK
jgi:cytochrome c6